MDLLNEAETALCASNEPNAEIPNGAAGHYLLGLIYRYTDRRKSVVHHFKLALSIDPLLWAAYEELCMLGVAEEASSAFGEVATLGIQKQYLSHSSSSLNVNAFSEDRNIVSCRNSVSEETSPRQLKSMQGNSLRGAPVNSHGQSAVTQPSSGASANMPSYNTPSPMVSQFSGVAPPPLCRNMQPNGPNLNTLNADSSPKSTVNSTMQAPRRKFIV